MDRTVGEVAGVAHVSVRTLHHYDRVGLLSPSGRSASGYRLYSPADMEALQEVLLYRRLGIGLDAIKDLRGTNGRSRLDALLEHRQLLTRQLRTTQELLGLVDRAMTTMEGGMSMTAEQMFEGLGDFDPSQYDEEAAQRWGDSDAYRESTARTRTYGREQWTAIRTEGERNNAAMAALMTDGVASDDPRAMDVAEQARLHIDRWFYPCSHEMHAHLGDMYVADERFAAHYEHVAPGLAGYVRDAILANGVRAAG